jgi:16S rRNA (cytidine1402-2'-O)-methyltransferase
MDYGKLLLIPSSIDESAPEVIPEYILKALQNIDLFFVEHERSARRYLRSIGYDKEFNEVELIRLDKDSTEVELQSIIDRLTSGKSGAVISEAGLPCIADPGSRLVFHAQEKGINIQPFVGPSSLLMTLMASGLNGQKFQFHGYLPIDKNERKRAILQLESEVLKTGSTQIFIETPYRNNSLISDLLLYCNSNTYLCIGVGITSTRESIKTRKIHQWKALNPQPGKVPAVFLLGSP